MGPCSIEVVVPPGLFAAERAGGSLPREALLAPTTLKLRMSFARLYRVVLEATG
jgi:hypothetical protein